MSVLGKRIVAGTMIVVIIAASVFFAADSYLQTNYLLLTNQSAEPVCVQTDYFETKAVAPGQTEKIKFKVKGDGSFSITNCDTTTEIQRLGYFTTNIPRCHLIEFSNGENFTDKTTAVKECKKLY